jgi:hypothetical protein
VTAFDVMLLLSFLGSIAALTYFFRYMDLRRTEQTAQTPPDLARAADYLASLEPGSVLVLPNMYADFVAYNAGKPVLWGGHSGNLQRLEEFFPVIRRPLDYFFERYAIRYVVLDLAYATPERLHIGDSTHLLEQFGSIAVFHVRSGAAQVDAPSGPTALAHSG